MKVIIAGSRNISDGFPIINAAVLASGFDVTEVVSGTAQGIDRAGEAWAYEMELPVRYFPANWQKDGKSAGYRRNYQMADYADALIAIWDGKSKGTDHMITTMKAINKPVYVHVVAA